MKVVKGTTRSRNVNDLLNKRCWILSLGPEPPRPRGTGMLTICPAVHCWKIKDKTAGTSTTCSTTCGRRSTKRGWMMSSGILGTTITCTTGNCVSRDLKMRLSHLRHRSMENLHEGADVRNVLQEVPLHHLLYPHGTHRQGGREPPWGRGASGTWSCGSTRTSLPALFFLCPLEEWCLNSERAIATAIRPWRRNERRRRSLWRLVLPVPPPSPTRAAITRKPPVRVEHKKGSPKTRTRRVLCTKLVVVVG